MSREKTNWEWVVLWFQVLTVKKACLLISLFMKRRKKGVYIRKWSMTVMTCVLKIKKRILLFKEHFSCCIFAWIDTLLDIMWFANFSLVNLKNIPDQECSFSLLIILLNPQVKCDSNLSNNIHSKSIFPIRVVCSFPLELSAVVCWSTHKHEWLYRNHEKKGKLHHKSFLSGTDFTVFLSKCFSWISFLLSFGCILQNPGHLTLKESFSVRVPKLKEYQSFLLCMYHPYLKFLGQYYI